MTRTLTPQLRPSAEPTLARTLVLFDGDLPSVLALAYAAEEAAIPSRRPAAARAGRPAPAPGRDRPTSHDPAPAPLAYPAFFGLADARERDAALTRCLDLLSIVRAPDDNPGLSPRPDSAGEDQSRLLVHAGYLAVALACDRVVWPVQFGEDLRTETPSLARVAAAIDRALLTTRLVALDIDASGLQPEIQTPFVDLSDHQIAEMVIDIEAPLAGCWWWGGTSPAALAAQDHWGTLLRSLGWGGALAPGT